MLSAFAPAKINLALHITGRRADSYHLLSSIVVFSENVGDHVEVRDAEALSLKIDGPFAAALIGNEEDNLVLRAARRLKEHAEVTRGAHISLHKNLPVASGIGGGSADAAAAVKLLNTLWKCGVSDQELAELMLPLGADIPVCLYGKSALVEGIGERITPLPTLPVLHMVLINSLISISTAEMFRAFNDLNPAYSLPITLRGEGEEVVPQLLGLRNDLEKPAQSWESIVHVLEILDCDSLCGLRRMSGSGATCFGIYDSSADARQSAKRLATSHPDWWVCYARTPQGLKPAELKTPL